MNLILITNILKIRMNVLFPEDLMEILVQKIDIEVLKSNK
jgi:hypothetical protein